MVNKPVDLNKQSPKKPYPFRLIPKGYGFTNYWGVLNRTLKSRIRETRDSFLLVC